MLLITPGKFIEHWVLNVGHDVAQFSSINTFPSISEGSEFPLCSVSKFLFRLLELNFPSEHDRNAFSPWGENS
ncbi:unnamed protein product [Heterobilharzia americana]|nr:unnamed protein product [Heterobilharzia americana]